MNALSYLKKIPIQSLSIIMRLFGVLWIACSAVVIGYLIRYRPEFALLLFTVTVSCDIFSYFGGKAWGKTKLAPTISPGKTIEGMAIGVLISASIATVLVTLFKVISLTPSLLFISMFFLACLSVMGDLLESYLKRKANIKDSGFFFYGHGGLLDRFDSALFIAPFFLLFIQITV